MSFLSKLSQKYSKKKVSPAPRVVPDQQLIFHLSEARIYLVQGRYKLALSHCQEALKLDMHNGDAYRLRSAILYELHDSEGALADLRHALIYGEPVNVD